MLLTRSLRAVSRPQLSIAVAIDNDGDTLTIRSDDVACPIGPGQYHGTGQWTVVGASGRFRGAVGKGSLDGQSDFIAGTFSVTLSGSLSLPDE